MKILLLLALMFTSLNSFAEKEGHGRDGGWPESITLLKVAKGNLLDLLAQASDKDIQEAINGMVDRNEYYKPEDINKELLTMFVKAVVEPDVLDIEKSDYTGIRLFYYDIKNPIKPKIYATKNFFNNPKYQAKLSEINVALIKEVQTLILHEISHLWGFGEETEETNYAEKFAVALVQILHGANKKNYTQKEKLTSLSFAYFQTTHRMSDLNEQKVREGKLMSCIRIDANGEEEFETTFNFSKKFSGLDGEEVDEKGRTTIYRATIDEFLFGEAGHDLFMASPIVASKYFAKQNVNREVDAYTICHLKKDKLQNYLQKFVAPFYSRSNLLTDLSNSSLTMFRYVLMSKVSESFSALDEVVKVMTANQEQIIRNINYKIKVQMKDDYDWLVALKYKYSKDKDVEVMNKFNAVINSDQSTAHQGLYSQIGIGMKKLQNEINLMKVNQRRSFAVNFVNDFFIEFNAHVDQTKDLEDQMKFSTMACGKYKKIGEYYKCFLDTGVADAENRIGLYKKMMTDAGAIVKKFETQIMNYKE